MTAFNLYNIMTADKTKNKQKRIIKMKKILIFLGFLSVFMWREYTHAQRLAELKAAHVAEVEQMAADARAFCAEKVAEVLEQF